MKKLETAYNKNSNKRAEMTHCFQVKQKPGQSLIEFSNDVRNQSVKCGYPKIDLDDPLSACFTFGPQSESTKRYLHSLPVSSVKKFDGLFEFAQIYGNSRAEASRFEYFKDVTFVKKIGFRSRGASNRERFRGRGRGNRRGGFTAPRTDYSGSGRSDYNCFECGSANHIRKDCPAQNQ